MTDRFDLEQQILDCWKITDEIHMMETQGANTADMTSLACVYEFKFKQLWATFEAMVAAGQFRKEQDCRNRNLVKLLPKVEDDE
jgi:hypothetical protein